MKNKPYRIVGDKIHPLNKPSVQTDDDKFHCPYGEAWKENGKAYLEFDSGHFASQMKRIEITDEEFQGLRDGTLTVNELNLKHDQA